MVHILLLSISGIALCAGMAFLADRIAGDLFRVQQPAGKAKR